MARLTTKQQTILGFEIDPQVSTPSERTGSRPAKKPGVEVGPENLGKPVRISVPDFSDPSRPKTCLEVDFPLIPVNALSQVEGNAGKPIYQMSKWWARRRSSVFRAMLIAAAMQAPIRKNGDGSPALNIEGIPLPDETESAKAVWDVYYANHQAAGNFKNLQVLDCFMGGGTTLVEGTRLGFQVTGVDLNPVAWFVVRNELANTDPGEVSAFFERLEAELKPVLQPMYVTDCPRGHTGRWYRAPEAGAGSEDTLMTLGFDPSIVAHGDRHAYRYEGPEAIYMFWDKHGQCSKPGCGHRTPIFRSPMIAEKKIGVKYIELTCKTCKTSFHSELGSARMAPGAEQVVLESESPFTELSQPFAQRLNEYSNGTPAELVKRAAELYEMVELESGLKCPNCGEFAGQYLRDILGQHKSATRRADIDKKHLKIQPPRNGTKHVYCQLLIDPDWLKGAPGFSNGTELGGYPEAPVEATSRWYEKRLDNLRLIEVRGRIKLADDVSGVDSAEALSSVTDTDQPAAEPDSEGSEEVGDRAEYGLPRFITLSDGRRIDTQRGTVPQQSHFICASCGLKQDLRDSSEKTTHAAPVAAYAIQGHCPACDAEGARYGGRFFCSLSVNDARRLVNAEREWTNRRNADLAGFWPAEEIPHSYMTHHANFALPKQGYTHWYKMFHPRQLLVHAQIAKFIRAHLNDDRWAGAAMQALGAHQQYLRNQCMFAFWHVGRDHFAPHFGNPNYAPKNNVIEVGLWTRGYGSWTSTISSVIDGTQWARAPWEPVIRAHGATKSDRVEIGDAVQPGATLLCKSASELDEFEDRTFDMVITDPPFGDNIFYSDLSNYFYAWLRLALRDKFPEFFEAQKTPNAQEALAPRLLSEVDANEYYRVRLTACWTEACRVLKDGGILAFTFHHSEESQWAIVLESLFEAGFILEQTFPIASDEQKGEGGQFGAKGTEYDIIHVCRKRLSEPQAVSWAKMRQWVRSELTRLKALLAAYKANQLSDADIRVILRGKALEFYSRHYGQVFTSDNEPLSIRLALSGINQLLDEGSETASSNPPSIVQPVAYQYLRLFTSNPSGTANEVSKSLFGTAVRQRDLEDRGWVEERNRSVTAVPIFQRFMEFRKRPRREMKTEIDQAHFLIGSAGPDSGVNLEQELSKDTWMVRQSVDAVLEWYGKMASDPEIRTASILARTILRQALGKLRQQPMELERQLSLFNDWDEGV